MNKSILLLSPNIASDNKGDDIIMECVEKELRFVTDGNFVYNMPTHLPAFHCYAVWRNSYAVQNYANCDWKFAGGSNLLVKDLKTHYPQWNIHPFNSRPLQGIIMVGVGALLRDSEKREWLAAACCERDYSNAGEVEKIYKMME